MTDIHEEICTILKSIEDSVTCHLCHCAPKPGSIWFKCLANHELCLNCMWVYKSFIEVYLFGFSLKSKSFEFKMKLTVIVA